ncbi:hypothetical protein D3C86_1995610 [compost metagenome]
MLSAAHIGTWFFGLLILAWGLIAKDMLLLQYLGIVFGIRWAIQWFLLIIINIKLDRTVEWFGFLLMDFALFVYYLVFGFLTMTSRKPRKSWN